MNKKDSKALSFKLSDDDRKHAEDYYSSFENELRNDPFYAESPNKKSYQVNMIFHKNDLILMDKLAEVLGVKRSEIIGSLVSSWVKRLFLKMPEVDMLPILNHVEKKITEEYKHHYNGQTWGWQVAYIRQQIEYARCMDENQNSLITKD